jgi:threonine aldolase
MDAISDFRSDTVTRPTEEMRRAMAEAVVGDDVLGDDPTVHELEALAAAITGKEAALYVPTGTMGNSIACKVWTRELDEVIVEERSHIYNMESTHMTFISRVSPRPLPSSRGAMPPDLVEANIKIPNVHMPRTSLVCVENTHNNWSGAVVPIENIRAIRDVVLKHGIKMHLDGARIFNASHASGVPVKEYASLTDSLMFCLSKGLSSPVGSLLVGPRDFIDYSRRLRKALGGGMRQVGVLAACGLVSLTKMTERLAEDNRRAGRLARELAEIPGVLLDPAHVQTNIVIFDLDTPRFSVPDFLIKLRERGILALAVKGGIRFVCHKDVGDGDVDRAVAVFRELLAA